jgi:hypothetical protein
LNAIDALIPINCSVGTQQFCIGFGDKTTCNNFPLELSDFIPGNIAGFITNVIPALQSLAIEVARLPSTILGLFSVGLALLALILLLFSFPIFFPDVLHFLKVFQKLKIALILGLFACSAFLIPLIIIHVIQGKLQSLDSSFEVEKGSIYDLCLIAICWDLFVMIAIITYKEIERNWLAQGINYER